MHTHADAHCCAAGTHGRWNKATRILCQCIHLAPCNVQRCAGNTPGVRGAVGRPLGSQLPCGWAGRRGRGHLLHLRPRRQPRQKGGAAGQEGRCRRKTALRAGGNLSRLVAAEQLAKGAKGGLHRRPVDDRLVILVDHLGGGVEATAVISNGGILGQSRGSGRNAMVLNTCTGVDTLRGWTRTLHQGRPHHSARSRRLSAPRQTWGSPAAWPGSCRSGTC